MLTGEKFVRLANKRVANAMKHLRLIGNLADRTNYDYTDEDVERVFDALQSATAASKRKFEVAQRRSQTGPVFLLK